MPSTLGMTTGLFSLFRVNTSGSDFGTSGSSDAFSTSTFPASCSSTDSFTSGVSSTTAASGTSSCTSSTTGVWTSLASSSLTSGTSDSAGAISTFGSSSTTGSSSFFSAFFFLGLLRADRSIVPRGCMFDFSFRIESDGVSAFSWADSL